MNKRDIFEDFLAMAAFFLFGLALLFVMSSVSSQPEEMEREITPAAVVPMVAPAVLTSEPVTICAVDTKTAPAPAAESESLGLFRATAYCPCEQCCGVWATMRPLDENGVPIVYTATGAVARQGETIAVDPAVIPYGTTVIIGGETYTATDCGGAIRGNRIDIYFDSHSDALAWGVQEVEVFIAEAAAQ